MTAHGSFFSCSLFLVSAISFINRLIVTNSIPIAGAMQVNPIATIAQSMISFIFYSPFRWCFFVIKRIIAVLCIFFNLFLVCASSACAASVSDVAQAATILDWLDGDGTGVSMSRWWDAVYANKISSDAGCPASSNGYHEWTWNNKLTGTFSGDLDVECKHCLLKYRSFLSNQYSKPLDDITALDCFKALYGNAVSSLPAQSYTSNGTMLWYPTFDDLSNPTQINVPGWVYIVGTNSTRIVAPDTSVVFNTVTYSIGSDNRSIEVYKDSSTQKNFFGPKAIASSFKVPISGTYTLMDSPSAVFTVIGSSCGTVSGTASFANVGQSWHCLEGAYLSQSSVSSSDFSSGVMVWYISGKIMSPVYSVIPDVVPGEPDVAQQYYDASTRIGNYVGSYAVYNSDYGYSYVGGTSSVVNENDNRVWNPVTNTTNDYSGWTYDYSTRTYNFYNDDNSSTSTVTYGDENITIADTVIDGNGNTITNNYTVYYCNGTGSGESDPSPSPSPSPGPGTPSGCNHSYKTTVTSEPTCTMAGSQTLTCSLCGETKKEKLPATGHIWVVRQTVTTAYDEEGNLVQQGYSIYKCSVCGEEYKDVDGVGPPGSSDDDSGGGLFDWLIGGIGDLLGGLLGGIVDLVSALLGALLDGLISLLEMLLGKLGLVVEAILSVFNVLPSLFQGFLDLLTALFPFIPEEAMAVLTFGIIAVVLVAIIRLFL